MFSIMANYINVILFIISMSSVKRTRDLSRITSLHKIDTTDPIWDLENQQLRSDAQANSRLKEEITKESYADNIVQTDVKEKISLLKEKAVALAKNLESEKRKNVELEAIIRHIKNVMSEEKKVEANHRDDMNFESVDNLTRRIKKSEYDLEQIISKQNDLNSRNKDKKNEVDTFRTQRVIDSGIFVKLEKEIVDSGTEYKKLLIQKTLCDQEYNKELINYKTIKNDVEKDKAPSVIPVATSKQEIPESFMKNVPNIEFALKFTELGLQSMPKNFNQSRQTFLLQHEKQKSNKREQMEYAVKKIFIQTGVNDAESLINYIENIETMNNQLFNQVNQETDKISELKKQIRSLESKRKEKTVKYYEQEPVPTKNQIKRTEILAIEEEMKKVEKTTNKSITLLEDFMKTYELGELGKMMNIEIGEQIGLDCLETVFIELEQKLNPLLISYSQANKQAPTFQAIKKNRESEAKEQTIDELMSRVKKTDESDSILFKSDFQKEYEQIRNRNQSKSRNVRKKATCLRKY